MSVRQQIKKHQPRAERIESNIPLQINGLVTSAKDISATGIFFELDETHEVGSKIQFQLDIRTPGGPLVVICEAQVTRVVKKNGQFGIGAKILNQEIKAGK
ncbi:PilZ domain-containing protein [Polynucleobacter sp. AP-Titi-500A-B4]|uniref:PilZ domain-containing protein n=1 Tax=Polynucleobacter sp. AP-Titi-500A-B4 TaxID=2576923 RepID=UPI001BFD4876|nr:PilZ domain-containing protein [Polynucleobacter sp. AP-Titi-500A-B4]QWE11736.1 PilZ domain-containing protein [Polynucleobacter sp. AP-Titi-500A-B4]